MILILLSMVASASFITPEDYQKFTQGVPYTIYTDRSDCPSECVDMKINGKVIPPAFADYVNGKYTYNKSKEDAWNFVKDNEKAEKENKENKIKINKGRIKSCIAQIDNVTNLGQARSCIKFLLKHAVRQELTSSELD